MLHHTGTYRLRAVPRTRHACCALLVAVGTSATAWPATQGTSVGRAAAKVTEPSPAGGSPSIRARRVVFTCVEAGLVTFADRPCSPWSQVRELHVVGVRPAVAMAPRAAASATPQSPAGRDAPVQEHHERDDDARAALAQACDRLQRALQELDARMRAGYSAREAGRLWSRWREAKERVREAGC